MKRDYDVLRVTAARAVAEIQAEEDRRIFEILDQIAGECTTPAHDPTRPGGASVRRADCPHPDCAAQYVLES